MGGALNNVATRKINCGQAAGLGGALGGQAGLKRPRLVIFQAGQEMRQAGAQLNGGLEEHGGRSDRDCSQTPVFMPELLIIIVIDRLFVCLL